jgi:hypothetical protein
MHSFLHNLQLMQVEETASSSCRNPSRTSSPEKSLGLIFASASKTSSLLYDPLEFMLHVHTEFCLLGCHLRLGAGDLFIAPRFHDPRAEPEDVEGARGIEPPPGFADRADGFEARGARQHHCPLEPGSIRLMSRAKNLKSYETRLVEIRDVIFRPDPEPTKPG